MKVKEILKMAAEMAGEKELAAYYAQNAVEDVAACEENASLMLRCYNMITEELALEYLPLRTAEKVEITSNKIYFSDLGFKPLRVIAVYGKNGEKVPYKLINDYLQLANGSFIIEYTYRVGLATADDDCVYDETAIGPYAIAYGILSQYLLERGRISESNLYQEKYLNAVRARIAQRKSLKLPARRWF
jgi:hypothetical protein